MSDMNLEKILSQGRTEAARFFGRPAAALSGERTIARGRHIALRPRIRLKAALGAACVFAAAVICTCLVTTSAGKTQQAAAGTAEQTVAISEDKEYRVDSIPVGNPNGRDSGLMMVLWENSGDKRMAYYSLFKQSDVAFPAMTIAFPGSDYDMLLISSGDSGKGSIGYRVVGFDGGALHDWWAQDHVPRGSVTLEGGIAVERRASAGEAAQDGRVTYIVPVQIKSYGGVVLPIDVLHIRIGEHILLVGGDSLEVSGGNALLSEERQQNGVAGVLFKALGAGSETLRVGPQGTAQTLSVNIAE